MKSFRNIFLIFLIIILVLSVLLIINLNTVGKAIRATNALEKQNYQESYDSFSFLERPLVAPYGYEYTLKDNVVLMVPGGEGYFATWSCSGCSTCKKESFLGNGTCEDKPKCPATEPCKMVIDNRSFTSEVSVAVEKISLKEDFEMDCEVFNLQVPEDATVLINGNVLSFSYMSPDNQSQTTTEISCDCTVGGDNCYPFYFKGKSGCAMGQGCTECTKTVNFK